MKFKNHFNKNEFPTDHEVNNKPSLTIPDQSMGIPEILRRFASGLPIGGQRVPLYEGEDDVLEGIDFRKLDLAEKHNTIQHFRDEFKELQTKDDDRKKKKQKAIDDAAFAAAVKKHTEKSVNQPDNSSA